MATLTIPNTFVNGQPADGTAVNANNDAISTVVNNLNDDNVAAGAFSEKKITFYIYFKLEYMGYFNTWDFCVIFYFESLF